MEFFYENIVAKKLHRKCSTGIQGSFTTTLQ